MPFLIKLFKKSRITAWTVFAATIIASVVLTGWVFNLDTLLTFINASSVTMKLNTSLGILCSVASLLFYLSKSEKRLAALFALIVFLIGIFTSSQYIFNLDFGIDEFLVKDTNTPVTMYPGRMAPASAIIFVMLGISLLLYSGKTKLKIFVVNFLATIVLILSFIMFAGYLFNANSLFKIEGLTNISIETTVAFLFFSTGLLFSRPESGFIANYYRDTKSAQIGGLHLFLIICLIILIGWLRLKGEKMGLYDTSYGLAIMIIAFIIVCAALSWYFVRQLNIAEEKIKKSEESYRSLFEQASDAIFINNQEGNLLDVNTVACDMLGFTKEQLCRMNVSDLFTINELSKKPIMNKELFSGERTRIERNIRRADNSVFAVDITAKMLSDGRIMAIVRDISRQKKAAEQLEASEDKYRQIVETAQEGIWMIDEYSNTTFVNEPMAHMLSYSKEEMIGKHLFDFMNDDGIKISEENIKRRKQGIIEQHDFAFQSKEGKTIWTLMETSPIFKEGKYTGALAMVMDITERKKAEQILKESEEKFRTLVEQAGDGIFIVDQDANYLEANERAAILTGYSTDELKQMNAKDIIPAEELKRYPLKLDEIKKGYPVFIERVIRKKDGTLIHVEISSKLMDSGKVIAILRDITGRKKIEEEKEKLLNVLEKSLNEIYIFNPDTLKFEYVNEGAQINLGYSITEMINMTPLDIKPEFTIDKFRKMLAPLINLEKEKIIFETVHKRKDKSLYPVEVHLQSITHFDKTVFLAVILDITERKTEENKKNRERMENEALINSTGDLLWSVSNDFKLITANNAYIKRFKENGYYMVKPGDNILSSEHFPEDYLQYWRGFYSKGLAGENVLTEIFTPQPNSSELLWFELKIDPILIDNKISGIACSMRDITTRKKENDEIRKINERFELIGKATNDALWELNLETNKVWGNEAHQQLYGLTLADKVPDDDEWKKRLHPEDKEQTIRIGSEALASKQTSFVTEYRLYTENKGWINVLCNTYIERNSDGKAIRMLGNMTNLTERKKVENALAESENYLRTIVQAEPECVNLLNVNYELLDMNPAGLAMIEADNLEQVKGKTVLGIIKKPYRDAFVNMTQNVFKGKSGKLEFEIEGLKGTRRWMETHAVPLKNAEGNIISLLAVTRDITEKKKAEDLLKKSYRDIRRLATHQEQVREDERIRIARDLHDELGQQLTVLKMDIAWIRKKIPKEEMINQKITELLSTVDNTIKTVRRISTELRPSVLDDLGLVAAMEWQSNEFEKRTGIETNLNSDIKELNLPDKIATGLFRIFQESLTNVARHAGATSVNALLGIENGKLRMQIRDNGKGFDQQTIEVKKTLGILGMRERTKIMGGEYYIESMEGKGSVIEVKIPISSITSI